VDDRALFFFEFEVWELEGPHSVERQGECLLGTAPAPVPSQVFAHSSQRTKHLRPIEPLTLTVLAVAHLLILIRFRRVASRRLAGCLTSGVEISIAPKRAQGSTPRRRGRS
jgi:hypothetical protein